MKISNKKIIPLIVIIFGALVLTSNSILHAQEQDSEDSYFITIPDFEKEYWCRCKHDGCHQGYWISFRKKCGSELPCYSGEATC